MKGVAIKRFRIISDRCGFNFLTAQDQICAALATGAKVGVVVDSDPGKADRCLSKIRAGVPGVRVISRVPGPVKGCVQLILRRQKVDERDPDLVNPGWVRPADWKYAEDWDSPAWRRRMAETNRLGAERRRKYGFIICPACKMGHTNFTLTCRECGHKCVIPEESSHASEVKQGVEPEQRPRRLRWRDQGVLGRPVQRR